MKYCCHRRLQKNLIAEETKKKQKSQAYYDQTAKDLTELKPGDTVRVRPEGLQKNKNTRKEGSYRIVDTVRTMLTWMVN